MEGSKPRTSSGIKVKLGGIRKINTSISHQSGPASPSPATAIPRSKSTIKIKVPDTPGSHIKEEEEVIKTSKSGRPSIPTSKARESLKRPNDESEDEDSISVKPAVKKFKLTTGGQKTPNTPVSGIKITTKRKRKAVVGDDIVPTRHPGDGYDSEDPEKEDNPAIEEQFILRMDVDAGDDRDYIRTAITDKKLGLRIADGGVNISMRFFDAEARRGCVTVRGNHYAATMVDLPTIIEGMKSWDKRGWWKSADICQMLLVFAIIPTEDAARSIDLPKIIDPVTHQYPHGITPPMQFARKRRFRKRISRTHIEAVEAAVQRMLKEDAESLSTKYAIIDPEEEARNFSPSSSQAGYGEYSEDEDANGEIDQESYFTQIPEEIDPEAEAAADAALAAEMEAEFMMDMPQVDAEATSTEPGAEPEDSTPVNAETPVHIKAEEDSGDESGDDSEEDEEEPSDVEQQEQLKAAHEDIDLLEKQLASYEEQYAHANTDVIRARITSKMKATKDELQIKRSALEGTEED